MRNFKKIIAVAITLVMLLSVAAIGASAETAPTISLVGASSTGLTDGTAGYYEVDVVLSDANNAVGGIEGVITYDKDVFVYDSVVLSDTFKANNTVDNSIAHTDGSIKFVGLATGDGVWFTIKFTVKAVAESTTIAFSGVKGAKADGSDYITVATSNNELSVVDNDVIKVGGAAIKLVDTVDAQDIKFEALVDADALAEKYGEVTVKKIGALMGVTQKLDGVDLVAGMTHEYVLDANVDHDTAENFAINLNNMTKALVGVKITSRVYIVVNDGTKDITIHSTNYDVDYSVVNGCASQSVLQVAKKAVKLAIENGFEDKTYGEQKISDIVNGSIAKDDALRSFIFQYIKDAAAADKLVK